VELDVHQPVLLRPGEGETTTDRPERILRILAELDDVIVSWFRYEPGEEGPEPHVHRQHTDGFYVLEGELEIGLGPDVRKLPAPAGTLAAAPPNVVHTFRNASEDTSIFLNIHAPSMGFGDVLRGGDHSGFDQFDPPADGGRPLSDAALTGPGEGESFENRAGVRVIKCDLPQLSVFDLTFQPGWEGVDPHVHADQADSFFVLEGEVEFILGDETQLTGPGSFIAAPRGARHGFRNPGQAPIRLLNFHAPETGFAERIRRG
jgi:quercetin dioxygenase-like cupin family protein